MSIQNQFEEFCENIKLTQIQRDDAKTKYSGVCKKLHDHFYPTTEYDGGTKLLFGSYAKHTAIRPISEDQDVDVLFKIPEDTFKQYKDYKIGGQSTLLQKIRDILLDSKYSLGEKPKAWGKVILIKTADGKHNIELLPAYENVDGTFVIPNSENGGSWDPFDPRLELERFRESNYQTDGLTCQLSRVIKRWSRETASLSIKSFEIENYVIFFLSYYDYGSKSYSQIVTDFFKYLLSVVDENNRSYVETAQNRTSKAYAFEQDGKIEDATREWKKVFGDSSFPASSVEKSTFSTFKQMVSKLQTLYPSTAEEYLDRKYGIATVLNPAYSITVDVNIDQNGWRRNHWFLSEFRERGFRIQKNAKLLFKITAHNVPWPYNVKWKVRNFGEEACKINALRGEITDDNGSESKKENTLYRGEHYVECYIIKNDRCVAIGQAFVPIS